MDLSQFKNQYLEVMAKNWLWFFALGIVLSILGVIAISMAALTTLFSVLFLGFLLGVGGVVIIIDAFKYWQHRKNSFFISVLLGILYIAVAMTLIQSPVFASVSLTLFLGIFYVVIGLFRIISALFMRISGWGWNLFNAIISLLLGILILSNWPQSSLFIIGLFVGIDLLITGWVYIMASLAAQSLEKRSTQAALL
ncbi:HdeD family acid-resistance protein [soil metagenome]